MWHVMASVQESYDLSERLLYAICCMQTSVINQPDSVVQLLDAGADVNLECGLKLPLHTACMATDSSTVEMLIDRGAQVRTLLPGYRRFCSLQASTQQFTINNTVSKCCNCLIE